MESVPGAVATGPSVIQKSRVQKLLPGRYRSRYGPHCATMAMRLPFPLTAMRVIRLIPDLEKSATSSHLPPVNGTTANIFESFAINSFRSAARRNPPRLEA